MPLPKRRFSRSRRDKRRLQIQVKLPTLTRCIQCGASVRPHHVCLACGTYRGRTIVVMKEKKNSSS